MFTVRVQFYNKMDLNSLLRDLEETDLERKAKEMSNQWPPRNDQATKLVLRELPTSGTRPTGFIRKLLDSGVSDEVAQETCENKEMIIENFIFHEKLREIIEHENIPPPALTD